MSRFANPKATERFVIPGPCACPGKPHDEDWIEVRTQLGTADLASLAMAQTAAERFAVWFVSWNLRDDDGREVPLTHEAIGNLWTDEAFFKAFDAWTTEHAKVRVLPNASGAPSANGSRGSAMPARLTPTSD